MIRIDNLSIRNYKSVKEVSIRDCKRYNILIGRPNVGKSNILEALSLFQIPYFSEWKVNTQEIFRIDNASSLFYLGDVTNNIEVEADDLKLLMTYRNQKNIDFSVNEQTTRLVGFVPQTSLEDYPIVRTYKFTSLANHDDDVEIPFLCPMTANNLSQIIKSNTELYEYTSELLSHDSLSLVFDAGRQEYAVMKKDNVDRSLILPLKAVADSLLRLIYYKTAVVSNHNAVIVMEEPEAHTFPPYISRMVHDVLDCKDNQFFIATHSPYVVNEFLQEQADVAVYIIDAKDGQTKVKRLTEEELSEVYDFGIDMFFNTEAFVN